MTYGAELELANVDTRIVLPEGNSWDMQDYTIWNNMINMWNDPMKVTTPYGGEINTKVCNSIDEAVDNIKEILELFPSNITNFSTNLHIHIGIDKLDIKQLADYVWRNQRELLNRVYIPKDSKYRRRKVSNGLKMPKYIRDGILAGGKDLGPTRFAINLKSLALRGTVEFRLFPMTTDLSIIRYCFELCEAFMQQKALPPTKILGFDTAYKVSTDTHLGRHSRRYVHSKLKTPIAFICYGNVNRSRAAEIIFRSLDVDGLFNISSFGIREGTYGKPLHSQTAKYLREAGYKWDNQQVSKQLPKNYTGKIINVMEWAEDPGYRKGLHYEAFKLVEAQTHILYRRLLGEEL